MIRYFISTSTKSILDTLYFLRSLLVEPLFFNSRKADEKKRIIVNSNPPPLSDQPPPFGSLKIKTPHGSS